MKEEERKVKTIVKYVLFGLLLVSMPASAGQGTDTGNGGFGNSLALNLPQYHRLPGPQWCHSVQGMINETLTMVQYSNNTSQARSFLVESIQNILAAYEGGVIPLQPMTYSLLSKALAVSLIFPSSCMNNCALPSNCAGFTSCQSSGQAVLGDQVAVIVLQHLLRVARTVSVNFDVPRFVPLLNILGTCGVQHQIVSDLRPTNPPGHSCNGSSFSPEHLNQDFYLDYIASTKLVIEQFFQPALSSQPNRGSLLEAMANDRWELEALSQLLAWIIDDISRDIFQRQLACVKVQLEVVKMRLDNYLQGMQQAPFNDRTMRYYVEQSLQQVLSVLQNYTYQNGQGSCR